MAGKNRPQTVGLTLALPVTEASSQYADASESNARSWDLRNGDTLRKDAFYQQKDKDLLWYMI